MKEKFDFLVGDRVTYLDSKNNKIHTEIISDENYELKYLKNNFITILKIERPIYERAKEEKKLLTNEEREFLKLYEKIRKVKLSGIEKRRDGLYLYINNNTMSFYICLPEDSFTNLQFYNIYELRELGLEEE